MSGTHLARLAAAFALLAAPAAMAQQVGYYSGTTADGSNISFTIGTDSNTNALQVTAVGIGFTDTCNPGSFSYGTGWGLGGDGTDLSGSTGTYTYSFGYLYLNATLKFSGNTLTGTVENATPTLISPATAGSEPKKAAYCSGKKQKFTATYSSTPPGLAGQGRGVNFGGKIIRH